MNILVVGATGATGRLLVQELLARGHEVTAVARSPARMAGIVEAPGHLSLVTASLLDLSASEVARLVVPCEAVASCLGHNLSWRGVFGPPHRLVTEATRRLCTAIRSNAPPRPVRFVLMNTAGNRNRNLDEPVSFAHRCVLGLLRRVLPPHADNEDAANFLRTSVGQDDPSLKWVVVRPDTLRDESSVSAYEVHRSPTRSAVFDPGSTSRNNVAHFMAELLTDGGLWAHWKGQMPVIYNKAPPASGSE